ncbi:uncharacterized protein KQ657_003480 [Scheffersomyces spartinae]|uniref:Uncharacterized protein n=1 Tax=Scheffersomyces spartinae TaxID=45513 RepID=A0A9P7V4Y5_9ASCO|nr:uncharacterized protein KQ657_003480 [Scheffersomyces spartinae]KAG7191433.1 hypothetical protein KQ657_003480 [Scheffersomyces spartinae]
MARLINEEEKKVNPILDVKSNDQVDLEANEVSQEYSDDNTSTQAGWKAKLKSKVPHSRLIIHILIGMLFTGWWLAIVIQDKQRHKWLIPTVIYGMIMVRLITWHWKILPVIMRYVFAIWSKATDIVKNKLLKSDLLKISAGVVVVVGAIALGVFIPSETSYSKRKDRVVSFAGLFFFIFLMFLSSKHKSKIQWRTILVAVLLQYIIALFVLRTKAGYDIFKFISDLARQLLSRAKDGVAFLTNLKVANLGMFFFGVLPAVIFFVAVVHIVSYYGAIQWAIIKFAKFFFWALGISGAESITTAASPFIGMGESAILIKDFLPYLTKAELHQIMTAGFATISGSVLVGYIGLGLNAQALVSSCVMSIPASVCTSKLRYPETEEPLTAKTVEFPPKDENEEVSENVLQEFSKGATLGLEIAKSMMTQCLCIIGLVYLINAILTWWGSFLNIPSLTLELLFSYLFYPLTFFLGPPREEIWKISKLIATKFVQNEYVAYSMLKSDDRYANLSDRGVLIATYALCGFANFGSVGITLGVFNTLTKGKRTKDVAENCISALLTGFMATMMSACIAGMVAHDLSMFSKN